MRKKLKKFGHPGIYKILNELADLHSKKNRDYATPAKPLGNFDRVAKWCRMYKLVTPGNEPVKVAIIYALKQLDAALKLLGEGRKGLVEDIPLRLRDIAVYMIIAEVIYEELRGKAYKPETTQISSKKE